MINRLEVWVLQERELGLRAGFQGYKQKSKRCGRKQMEKKRKVVCLCGERLLRVAAGSGVKECPCCGKRVHFMVAEGKVRIWFRK